MGPKHNGTGWWMAWTGVCVIACGGATTEPTEPQAGAPPSAARQAEAKADNGCPPQPDVAVLLPIRTSEETRWMMHARQVEAPDMPAEATPRRLSPEELQQLGVPPEGGALWVFFREEAPPCRMEAGAPWVAALGDGPAEPYVLYEVDGDCSLDADRESYLALCGERDVRGCRSHGLPTIASDETGQGKPVPREVQAVLPDEECDGAGCFRWIYKGVKLDGGEGVYELAAVWVHPPEGDDPPCAAPFDGFRSAYYRPGSSAAWQPIPGAQDVRAVLYDPRGLHAVVTDSRGVLGLHAPGGDGALAEVWRSRYTSWNEESQTPLGELEPSCL